MKQPPHSLRASRLVALLVFAPFPLPGFPASLPAAILTAVPTDARAAVIPISQTREVSAFASISAADGGESQFDSQQQSSPDPGSFSDSVTARVEDGATLAEGFAIQSSTIEPGLIQANGRFHARAELADGSPFAEGMGFTKLTHRFQVEGTTPYTIAGTLEGAGAGRAFVSLVRLNSGAIIYLTAEDAVLPVYAQGVLEAGIYDVSVWTFGFGQAIAPDQNNPASGRFQMSLTFADPLTVPEETAAPAPCAWPNPLRTQTTISLDGSGRGRIGGGSEVLILDVAGRRIRSLGRPEGDRVVWDARDDSGGLVAPGVYFIRAGDRPGARVLVLR